MVRVAAMADRSALAVPDSRSAAREARLPGAHRVRQAENPGAYLSEVVWHPGGGHGFLQACSERLPIADDRRAQDASGVRHTYRRQHVQDEGDIRRSRHRAGPYPLWVDAVAG